MINLLPPAEKRKLLDEKRKKMVIIFWFLAFFFLFCLVLVLFVVKIHFISQLQSQKAFSSAAKDDVKEEKVKEHRKEIEIINSELKKAEMFYGKKIYFSEIIEKISLSLPDQLYLNDLSLIFSPKKSSNGKDKIKVSLQGFALSRELLFDFKNKIEEEKDFINGSFPPSNWVKAENINFSVSFDYELH